MMTLLSIWNRILLSLVLLWAVASFAQDTVQLSKDDARLNQVYQQRVAQNNPATKPGNPIPQELWGKWIIRKELPANTISCWDEKQAKALLGTELEYRADSFRWKTTTVRNLGSTTSMVQAQQFAEDNSGSSSQVNFQQLGIAAATVKQIAIQHPDVTIRDGSSGGTSEMPGDSVLMKSPIAIVFSMCNVYFEADRAANSLH